MDKDIIDFILTEINKGNFATPIPQMICVNNYTYNKIIEQIQNENYDYDNILINNLGSLMLAIDSSLKDYEIKIC